MLLQFVWHISYLAFGLPNKPLFFAFAASAEIWCNSKRNLPHFHTFPDHCKRRKNILWRNICWIIIILWRIETIQAHTRFEIQLNNFLATVLMIVIGELNMSNRTAIKETLEKLFTFFPENFPFHVTNEDWYPIILKWWTKRAK